MADLSSTAISSLGIGSGLDLSSLLSSLQTAQQQRLVPLQSRQADYQSQLSAYGQLASAVQGLQSSASALGQASLYGTVKTSSSDPALGIAAGSGAVPGAYQVSVSQLAQAQTLVAQGVTSDAAAIGNGGQITISVGTATPVTINLSAEQSTPDGIRDAINAAGAGVTASIINDGSASPWRLVLTSNSSGAANTISVAAVDAAGGGTALASWLGTGSLTQTVAPQDAKLNVNGIAIQSASNSVQGAIQGVTLDLNATTTQPAQVNVTLDSGAVTNAIQGFVSAYNSYIGTLSQLTAFNGTSGTSANGVLLGDSAALSVASQLSAALGTPSASKSIVSLGDLGITLQAGGTLQVDSTKLSAAVAADPNGVAEFFMGNPSGSSSATGLAGAFSNAIANLTGPNGLLVGASNGAQASIKQIGSSISDVQQSIDATIANYQQQFQQLDSVMANLNSISSYLTQQFAQLMPTKK